MPLIPDVYKRQAKHTTERVVMVRFLHSTRLVDHYTVVTPVSYTHLDVYKRQPFFVSNSLPLYL